MANSNTNTVTFQKHVGCRDSEVLTVKYGDDGKISVELSFAYILTWKEIVQWTFTGDLRLQDNHAEMTGGDMELKLNFETNICMVEVRDGFIPNLLNLLGVDLSGTYQQQ